MNKNTVDKLLDMHPHIVRHIDSAIDALIAGNWDASLYTADDLLELIRAYEHTISPGGLYPRITQDDCQDYLRKETE